MNDFVEGHTKQLLINLPPRHSKTTLCSIILAAWILAHRPSENIMVLTYSAQLAENIARSIRAILQARWFKDTFSTRLDKSHSSVMDFATTAGGGVYAAPMNGSILGRGASVLIIDDPHDSKDAANIEQINATINHFNTTVRSRLNNPMYDKVIIVAQRIHENDLSGHLQREGGWTTVALPMIAYEQATYETDYGLWTRQPGDLLRQGAYSPQYIEALKRNTHNPGFDLFYQQMTASIALPAITANCFGFYSDQTFLRLPLVMSIDPGTRSGRRNSFNTIQIWCMQGDIFYLVDQWRSQCGFDELLKQFRRLASRYRPSAILVEGTANGPALISAMNAEQQRLTHEVLPRDSKTARVLRHIDTILGGRLCLPGHAEWRNYYIKEFVTFPYGIFTDQVDATTQFLDFMAECPQLALRPSRPVGIVGTRSGTAGSNGVVLRGDSPHPRAISKSVGKVARRR